MSNQYVVMFVIVVLGVIAAVFILPPVGKLEVKAVPGN